MTRTTELLKEIEAINGKSMIFQDTYDKRNNLKSELKGRLDVLKEEVEFLEDWRCKLNLWIAGLKLKDEKIDEFIEIIDIYEDKINYLKQQIKKLESAGVGK